MTSILLVLGTGSEAPAQPLLLVAQLVGFTLVKITELLFKSTTLPTHPLFTGDNYEQALNRHDNQL